MARNVKQGLSYFPLDVDIFEDIKIRKLQRACGNQSISVYIYILCNVYRNEGYYFGIGADETFLIAEKFGVSEGAITEIVKKAVSVGLFDCHKYEEYNILTSRAIQERFFRACKDCKKKVVRVTADFLLIDVNSGINVIYSGINSDNSGKNDPKKSKVYKEYIYMSDAVKEKFRYYVQMRHFNEKQIDIIAERLQNLGRDETEYLKILDRAIIGNWKTLYPLPAPVPDKVSTFSRPPAKNKFNNFPQRTDTMSAEELEALFNRQRPEDF